MPEEKKAKKPKAAPAAPSAPVQVGAITHFFPKISVAVVKLSSTLKVGDRIKIEGHGQSFEQNVDSMQVEHEQIKEAKKGQQVGMKTAQPVHEGDLVFKV